MIVLCSILILLAISKPEKPDEAFLNMQLLSLHVPLEPARFLLWLSAAYYCIGLWLEADTVRRINTRLFDGGMGSFQEALASAAQRVVARVGNVENAEINLSPAYDAVQRIKKMRLDVEKYSALIDAGS